jgi:hypothetical protein
MKFYKKLAIAVSSVLVSFSFQANAATSISKSSYIITDTTGATSTEFLNTNGAGWVSESMGFLGWTHFSKWGFVQLKKGVPVTIVADATAVAGYHPGITVWQRKTKASLPTAVTVPAAGQAATEQQSLFYMNDHFYDQMASIQVPNASDETNNVKLGNIIMDYVASGFDMDGLGDKFTLDATSNMLRPYNAATDATASVYGPYLPMGYITSGISGSKKLSDAASKAGETPVVKAATPGRVALTFTPKVAGIYQFVVGGLKPDVGSKAAVNAGKGVGSVNSVFVTVKQ